MTIIPIILSGGAGKRLWPLSRNSKPKQFLKFGSDKTLFQDTALRCTRDVFDPIPIVAASQDHRFLVAEDLREIGITANILLEPVPRNSCAAIAAGCFHALTRSTDAIVLAIAADLKIADIEAFTKAASEACRAADAGYLVTFGVKPSRPATGYGYINPGMAITSTTCSQVAAFVEKPSTDMAEIYLAEGYYWNSGNFLFKAKAFHDQLVEIGRASCRERV